MKMIPTTLDRKAWKKWLICPALALFLVLSSLPVYAGEQQMEVTETPTVTQETDSELTTENEASGEQDEMITTDLDSMQPINSQEVAATSTDDWTTTLPHEGAVLDGGFVGFKNKYSEKYLTIQGGTATSGTNVCQQSLSTIVNAQEFNLQYTYDVNNSLAYFSIYPISSSGSIASTLRVGAGATSTGSANVLLQTTSVLNSNAKWQIEHVVDNYYCVYLANNPGATGTKYALTANIGNGSITPVIGALDNIYVTAYTGHDSQLWQICADAKPMDINGYDITQGGSKETVRDTSFAYYYVPKSFNTTISWGASPEGFVLSDGNGVVTPTHYGEMSVTLSISNASISLYTFSAVLYSLPEASNVVYFSNAETGKYSDIEGSSTNNDAIIEQRDYTANQTQKWRVYHDAYSVGYIRLRSVHSAKYLAIDSIDNSIIEQTNASSDYSLWKLDWTATGNVVLICKATEDNNMVLSVPLNQNSNGTNLTMLAYTDDSNYNDEWYILDRVLSYVNYYDSTFVGNNTMIQNISEANSFAHLAYARYYHLGFYMDGAASQYATLIDECNLGTTTPCSNQCGLNCYNTHHKNILAISDQIFYGDRENDHVYVLWTNRNGAAYCAHDESGTHGLIPDNALAVVLDYRPVIHFFTVYGGSNNQIAYMAINLVHETAHTLGMLDVYNIAGHDEEYGMICVMEQYQIPYSYDFYLDVCYGEKEPFCNMCTPLIELYANITEIVGTEEE